MPMSSPNHSILAFTAFSIVYPLHLSCVYWAFACQTLRRKF